MNECECGGQINEDGWCDECDTYYDESDASHTDNREIACDMGD